MKAILATAAGSPKVLQAADLPLPPLPSPHHVRVKLAAAGVNPVDAKLRASPAYHPDKLPAILGCDGAGLVDEVGDAVTRFEVGDAVFFCNGGIGDEPGCYAEYTTVHEDFCAAKPAQLSMQQAAALPLVCITAWEALVERARLQTGQTVLIHAGAGGVGHIALQLARHLGARVATTVSDETKAEFARALGAERIIRYRDADFVLAALAWTNSAGVDVVFDTVGGDTFLRSFDATRLGGTVASLLATAMTQADVQKARLRNLTLGFELMLTPQLYGLHAERVRQRAILERCAAMYEAGQLKVHISHTLPLQHAAEAHRLIEAGGTMGKIVLVMD